MGYNLEITDAAKKEMLKKLPRNLIDRIDKRVQKLKKAPTVHGKPLRRPLAGYWEIRFEKRYRVLYEINENTKTIYIVGFKHKNEMERLTQI